MQYHEIKEKRTLWSFSRDQLCQEEDDRELIIESYPDHEQYKI